MAEKVIAWFQIPAADFPRAVTIYNKILGLELQVVEMDPEKRGMFPAKAPATGGAVVETRGYRPGEVGTMVFLAAGDDLSKVLSRVEGARGKELVPKTLINEETGYFAIFSDTEGNKVGLHSMH